MSAIGGRAGRPRQDEARNEEFRKVFGVSADELQDRGLDPDQYARDNIRDAVRDKKRRARWMSEETNYGLLSSQWGWRAYAGLFAALGLLFVQKALPRLAPTLIALEAVIWFLALAMFILSVRYRRLQRKSRQAKLRS